VSVEYHENLYVGRPGSSPAYVFYESSRQFQITFPQPVHVGSLSLSLTDNIESFTIQYVQNGQLSTQAVCTYI